MPDDGQQVNHDADDEAVPSWRAQLAAEQAGWREAGRWRQRVTVDSAPGRQLTVCVAGNRRRKLINWASNDYLGLASDVRVRNAAAKALRQYGAGSGSARLLGGGLRCHRRLEERLAKWLKMPEAL